MTNKWGVWQTVENKVGIQQENQADALSTLVRRLQELTHQATVIYESVNRFSRCRISEALR